MTAGEVERELHAVFQDWDGLLVNPRFCRVDNFVTWTAYTGGRLKEPVTGEQVLRIIEENQYTFQCAEDGSLFQMLYRFDEANKLTEARLGFYFVCGTGSFEEGSADITAIAWLRMDYDLAAANGVLHAACHLHVHGFPNARVPVNGVPGPRQFVEFVVSTCYPDYYKVHRLEINGDPQKEVMTKVNACQLSNTFSNDTLLHFALSQ